MYEDHIDNITSLAGLYVSTQTSPRRVGKNKRVLVAKVYSWLAAFFRNVSASCVIGCNKIPLNWGRSV